MINIAVGSKNPVKVASVENVVCIPWPLARVTPIDVSYTTAQPRNDAQTVKGALYRARAVRDKTVDLAIGLEGGVTDTPYGMFLVNWAVAIDRQGIIGYGGSTRLMLPECIAAEVRKGRELGPVMDEFTGILNTKQQNGAVGVFTDNLVTRKQSFEHAVSYAIARFLHPQWY